MKMEILKTIGALKPGFSIDGNKYCFLYGENLQNGISGFGATPYDAAVDFYNNFKEGEVFNG
jgi:hypothetical protein